MAKRITRTEKTEGMRDARAQSGNSIESTLGATLRQLRLARGMNQTELGERLGVSLQQVQKYESGANRMAASTLYRAAGILGVEVSALYAGLGGPKKRSAKNAKNAVLVIPLAAGARAARAREAELIDVIRHYQAIDSASERGLVRKLLARLSVRMSAAPVRGRAS